MLNKIFKRLCKKPEKKNGFVFTAIALAANAVAFIAASAVASLIGGGIIATAVGITAGLSVWGAAVFGGVALSRALSGGKKTSDMSGGLGSSPTYSETQMTQANDNLRIQMTYGEVFCAGNRTWQSEPGANPIKAHISFGAGEINDFTDIKINGTAYNDSTINATITKFYGTESQQISSLVPGATNAARAEVTGGLLGIAYLAVSVPVSDKVNGNFTLTTVEEGRLVRVYTNEDTYTTIYSSNPAWCLLDFLTDYNGVGIGLNDNGERVDSVIKSVLDIDSFIEAAEYCDEVISYDALTVSCVGDNNDLIWQAKAEGSSGLSIEYINPGTPNAAASVDYDSETKIISVNLATNGSSGITTTANDIISLIVNHSVLKDLVRIYNDDSVDSDGSGVVAAYAQTAMTAGSSDKRCTFNMTFDTKFSKYDVIEEFKKNCNGAFVLNGAQYQFKIDKPGVSKQVIEAKDILKDSEEVWFLKKEEHYDICRIEYPSPEHEFAKIQASAERAVFFNTPGIKQTAEIFSINNFYHASRLAHLYLNRNDLCRKFGKFSSDMRVFDREVGDVITLRDTFFGTGDKLVKIISKTDNFSGVYDVSVREYDENIYNGELGSQEPTVNVINPNNPYAIPGDVPVFSVVQNLRLLQFAWAGVEGLNVTYEIREGASWVNSSLIANALAGNSYAINLSKKGTLKFWIKAKSASGTYSSNAIFDVIQVDLIPELNVVVEENIFESTSGTCTNTYIYNERLKLNPVTLWQDLTPTDWADSGSRYYADSNNLWGGSVETSGSYESEVYDIGANLNSIISFNYNVYQEDSASSVVFEWKYSEDNVAWTDWSLINTGSYQFRYYQLKITISSPNGTAVIVSDAVMSIDVPDRIESYTNREITVANNGVTITFASDLESKIASSFIITEPQILATSKSNSAYAVVASATSSACIVKLYDNSGTLTTGFVNIQARGY